MRFNNCVHEAWKGIPSTVGLGFTIDGEPYFGSPPTLVAEGRNVDALVWEQLFAPNQGTELPFLGYLKGRGTSGMDSILSEMLDEFERSIQSPQIAAGGFLLLKRRLTQLTDISILNFIFELKDLKKSLKDWRSKIDFLKKLLHSFGDLNPRHAGSVFKRRLAEKTATRRGANAYLDFKFNWQPLFRDLVTILKALGTWRARLKKLLARLHKMRRAFVRVHRMTVPPSIGEISRQGGGGTHCDGQPDLRSPPSYRVDLYVRRPTVPVFGVKYTLYCQPLSDINAKVRGLLDTFGVRWDPSIIWNAIPLSFIIDWFYDVSTWLEAKWATPTVPVKLRVFDSLIQWRYLAEFRITITVYNRVYSGGSYTYTPVSTETIVTVDRFRRQRYTADVADLRLASWDRYVIDKTLLGGALVLTNNPRKHNHAVIPK
jgi:hypothetical protein